MNDKQPRVIAKFDLEFLNKHTKLIFFGSVILIIISLVFSINSMINSEPDEIDFPKKDFSLSVPSKSIFSGRSYHNLKKKEEEMKELKKEYLALRKNKNLTEKDKDRIREIEALVKGDYFLK